ncbi:MAG: TonB-dependent receptor [Chitinophagales bacterium]|nr:TonB-dependent receptor [Bacteroidota bacterium]MCB9227415.1 TonB-dependent receptor [Chitinophagales bacterium]
MKHIFFTLLLTTLTFFTYAQNGTIKGKVTEQNGEPAIQANIIIDVSKGWATVTDFDGNYTLSVPAGSYAVLYRYIGKEDKIIKVDLKAGETITENVAFKEKEELINTVVVSASKYEKKLSEETVSMEVLKSDLLQANNITNVEDGMNKVPGVTLVEGQANIRGGAGWSYGAGSRVMILFDDMPLLSADAADTKWSFMPTENIEQIEVIKGAASSLYGSGALNGVINVRTGYAKSTPETNVSIWSGIFAGPRDKSAGWWYDDNSQPFFTGFNFVHKRKIKRFDVVVNGAFSQNKDPLKENSGGDARVGGKFRFRPKKVEGLSVGVNLNVYRSWGSAFFLWNGSGDQSRVPMPNTASAYQNNRIAIDPFITYVDKKENTFSLKTRYFNTTNRNNTGQGSKPIMYMFDAQYSRYFNKLKMSVVGGLFGYYSTVRSPEGRGGASLVGEHNGTNIAPYVQLEKKLFANKLNLTFGSRYEFFYIKSLTFNEKKKSAGDNSKEDNLNRPLFRVGANYSPAKATFIRASWGEGFRYPSMAELYINSNIGGIGLYPNPKLRPEKGWYAELGVKQGFKIGDWGAYVDVAGFVNKYQDMMEFNFGQFGEFNAGKIINDLANGTPLSIIDLGVGFSSQNVGETLIAGVEISGGSQGKIGNFPLNILVGYTYIEPIPLNWDDPVVFYNTKGEEVIPGESGVEQFTNLSSTSDGGNNYSSVSSSNEKVLKYRNKHTFMIDVSTSFKKFDFGISVQYRSWMQNIDQLFVSDLFTETIPEDALIRSFTSDINNVEELIGTEAFSGLKAYRQKYDGRGTTLLDARIAYNFNDRAKLSLVGKNLLNLTYDIRPTLLGDPMSFALQFNYNFKHDKK